MRVITKEYKIYKFNEAPREIKDRIKERFFNGDLYQSNMDERIETLIKLAKVLNGKLNYSLSCVPDRGEYIKITPLNDWDLDFDELQKLLETEEDCPLTGCCYDHDILNHLVTNDLSDLTLQDALNAYIKSIHDEYESMTNDDEYINDLCESNEYEFYETGEIYV